MTSLIYSFFHKYAPRLFPIPSPHQKLSEFQSPNSTKAARVSNDIIQTFQQSSLGNEFSYTCLETASLVLRTTKSLDSRLQNIATVDTFFEKLEALERKRINRFSFESKSVIAVEGLPKSGKTTLINTFKKQFERVKVISKNDFGFINDVREIFHSMPGPISKAFDFIVNYFIAAEIVDSPFTTDTLFMIENYHLHFLVNNMLETIECEDRMRELSNSFFFDWILDLPFPLAVLFISVTPSVLNHRLSPTNTLEESWAHRFNMAFNMFRGMFALDGSLSPADLFQQAVDQLLQLNIPITRKEDHPSYLTFLTNHLTNTNNMEHHKNISNSNNSSTLTTPSKQPPLVEVVTPIHSTIDNNSSPILPPLSVTGVGDSPIMDTISPNTTRTPLKSLRSFRQVSMGVYGVWKDV